MSEFLQSLSSYTFPENSMWVEEKELINAACGGKGRWTNSHLCRNQIAHKGQKASGYDNPSCGESLRPAEDPNKKIKTTESSTNFPSSYV